ncbi:MULTISPECIES: alkaline phosphatase D family protein [unclassified Agarivorans]|uniref:alkaline phosphatase D family protein n=1 Tax=unclassified Agarivorans TaxID=2636026 RepID=UPI0026E27082|nr:MULTISPECIES: alkaline phosphatase D family protein [unclassified Agarivorans]MDO6683929.1 alkaline phosphatase D family protein [Agarivorans sp. 3_MG-2023]MDO6714338.1 alkaline phosphatase D family protein [Agarivorans sp. 2_MG-2023]
MSRTNLALVLAGPILRQISSQRFSVWLATSQAVDISLSLQPEGLAAREFDHQTMGLYTQQLPAGEHLFYQLIDIPLEEALPAATWVGYDLKLRLANQTKDLSWQEWAPELVYPPRNLPGFIVPGAVKKMLHGSCRKPHHPSADGLVRADAHLAEHSVEDWPSVLMLSGDQIYADDVATPMLVAIHRLVEQLGVPNEPFSDAKVAGSDELHAQAHYLSRQELLPMEGAKLAQSALFSSVRKPIFTSDNANNHLISLAEVLAMYLLVWSPGAWTNLELSPPESLSLNELDEYLKQRETIISFSKGLAKVQRLMAHLPTAMMFDDHDVTDDWNLTAAWEQSAYGHAFSKRIIGNALVGYLLCQGWGNAPEHFSKALIQQLQQALQQPGNDKHQQLIDTLLSYPQWHYHWDTQPPLLVLDTRTHRWRSERNLNSPSGLMDWESLTDLQQQLLGKDAVILVSPAPIFGVKLIEVVQRVFTWFGKPLLVDAENWMAHPGSANALLNLFRHPKTPQHFVILSGDVHYSFAYHIQLRGRQGGPDIWQITSSGIKNQFPESLLNFLDRANRWLYSPKSPLNWLTKRRRMRVVPHRPENASKGERLLNASGIGLLELNTDGSPKSVKQLTVDGNAVAFEMFEQDAHWD